MEYRSLGRTGVKVSTLCFGVMSFGRKTNQSEANKMVDHFISEGGNFIDTADAYGQGLCEEMLGKALVGKKRDQLIIATKFGRSMNDNDVNAWGTHRRHIISACEDSLRRLGLDYIDLYQVHRPQADVPIDETLRALDDLIHAGKIRYIGSSTFPSWQIIESLWASNEWKLNRFVTEQPSYNILDRRIERELLPACIKYGIGIMTWSPLAGGRLTGKYEQDKPFPQNARLDKTRFNKDIWRVLEGLAILCKEKKCSMSAFSLAWILSTPGIMSAIIGPIDVQQLSENLKALNVVITPEDRKRVDALIPPASFVEDYYNLNVS
ncbi:MAG: aldo/keto reductase [Patescibacteria group bacterium]